VYARLLTKNRRKRLLRQSLWLARRAARHLEVKYGLVWSTVRLGEKVISSEKGIVSGCSLLSRGIGEVVAVQRERLGWTHAVP
jgi:hypothetical protein